jgi:hypothetical protein
LPSPDGRLRIALLYGAEPYQAYHVADIGAALARDPGVDLTIVTLDAQTEALLDRLEAGQLDRRVPHERLHIPLWVKLARKARLFGILKQHVLSAPANVARLAEFDAIVTPTTHLAAVRERIPRATRFVYCFHGAGGRGVSYSAKMRAFDYIVVPGEAAADRLVSEKLASPSRVAAVGLPKLETCRRLVQTTPNLFDNGRPTVLFNPHSQRRLRSWDTFARPLIDHAARTGEFNLIVAPHVKLFARRPRFLWRRWERMAVPGRVQVDLGSEASQDMRYALAADIYAGDVSSQVYEFLVEPKPCVFLNAHDAKWRTSRDYPMWRLGEVADTPGRAIALIRRAADDHPRFIALQREERVQRIGTMEPGAAGRAAQSILAFLRGP